MTEQRPAAILWDMDGTIVDTEPYWLAAELELVHSWGGTWSHEDGLTLVGSGLWHSASVLRGRGVELADEEIIDLLTDRVLEQIRVSVPWRPGAQRLLAEAREAGIPTALVTMSIRRMADHIVSTFPFDAFDQVVAGDEVSPSKPHPAPYLRAAELLGVPVEECVAIEDSTTGLASAVAAGTVAVGVPLHTPLEHGLGYTIWPTLEGRTLADVSELYRTTRDLEAERTGAA